MGGISLIREDNVFKGLSDAMIDQRFNWCARCEVFGLHTQDAAGNAICPEQWVGPRPTFNAGGMMGPLQCTFEGCPAGTTANIRRTRAIRIVHRAVCSTRLL